MLECLLVSVFGLLASKSGIRMYPNVSSVLHHFKLTNVTNPWGPWGPQLLSSFRGHHDHGRFKGWFISPADHRF